MRTRFRSLLALLPLIAACGTRPDPTLPELSISIVEPTQKVYTRGDPVPVKLDVDGEDPDKIEILRGPVVVDTLGGEVRAYTFETASLDEGVYELTARASRGPLSFTSEVRTVVVDRTAPVIIQRRPADLATNVSVREPIELVFNEVIDTSTLNESTVSLMYESDDKPIPTNMTVQDGYLLRVTPVEPIRTPLTTDELRLSLSVRIADLAGNGLQVGTSWSWTVPRWVQYGGQLDGDTRAATDASWPALEFDSAGNPVVGWLETDATTTRAHLREWKNNAWAQLGEPLGPVTADPDAPAMDLTIDVENKPIVAYRGHDGTAPAQYVFRWEEAVWTVLAGPVRSQPGDKDRPVGVPSIDATGSDTPVLAWDEFEPNLAEDDPPLHGDTRKVMVFEYAGVSWDPLGTKTVSRNEGTNTPSTRPCVKRTPGSAYVGFHESDGFSVFSFAQTDEEWQPLGAGFGSATGGSCSIDVLSGGNPFLAANTGASFAPYAWNGTSNTWDPRPSVAGSNGSMRLFDLSRPVIAYEDGTGAIAVSRWSGTAWESLTLDLRAEASLVGVATGRHPALAVSAEGDIAVAWVAELAGKRVVHVHRFNE